MIVLQPTKFSQVGKGSLSETQRSEEPYVTQAQTCLGTPAVSSCWLGLTQRRLVETGDALQITVVGVNFAPHSWLFARYILPAALGKMVPYEPRISYRDLRQLEK